MQHLNHGKDAYMKELLFFLWQGNAMIPYNTTCTFLYQRRHLRAKLLSVFYT